MLESLPKAVSRDHIEPLLSGGERLVSSFGPYHATSRRIILLYERRDDSRVHHELPYTELESITEVQALDKRRLALGAVMVAAGLATMFVWFLIMPIVAVAMGIIIILQGSVGRPAYYQLKARGVEGRALRRWQVKHYGAGSFIASISEMTGKRVAKQ